MALEDFAGTQIDADVASELQTVFELLESFQEADGTDPDALVSAIGGGGDFAAALALDTARTVRPIILNNLGEMERQRIETSGATDYQPAQAIFDEALALAEAEEISGRSLASPVYLQIVQGLIYNNKGLSAYLSNDPAALNYYEQALQRLEGAQQRLATAGVLVNRGFLYEEMGETSKALDDYLKAMRILEEARVIGDSRLTAVPTGANMEVNNAAALNGTVFQLSDTYNYAVRLALKQARFNSDGTEAAGFVNEVWVRQAFDLAERGRARLFLELMATNQLEASNTVLADLLRAERRAYADLLVTRDTAAQFRSLTPPSPLTPEIEKQERAAEAAHQAYVAQVRAADSALAELLAEQGGVRDSRQVQTDLIPLNSSIVVYYTYDQRIFPDEPSVAFVLKRDRIAAVALPDATAAELNMQIGELPASLVDERDVPHPRLFTRLHDLLIAPIDKAGLLDTGGAGQLLGIVPHQQLHYVYPFRGGQN